MGEKRKAVLAQKDLIARDKVGGHAHVEWDPNCAVTPLGQLPFFSEFLKVSGLDNGIVGFKRYVSLSVLARNIQILGNIIQQKNQKKLKKAA